jgi:hypothetical protein
MTSNVTRSPKETLGEYKHCDRKVLRAACLRIIYGHFNP